MTAQEIAGARRCMFGTSADDCCRRPAVVHVMQLNGTPTMSCNRHAGCWTLVASWDLHPIGGECGLPDTTWIESTEDEHGRHYGRCVIEGLDLPDLFATEAELAGVTA